MCDNCGFDNTLVESRTKITLHSCKRCGKRLNSPVVIDNPTEDCPQPNVDRRTLLD